MNGKLYTMTTYKVRGGVEAYVGQRRVMRLTPPDLVDNLEVPDNVAPFLDAVILGADMADIQPGDGEFDIPIGSAKELENIVKALPVIGKDLVKMFNDFLGNAKFMKVNVFLRVERVVK